MSYSLSFSFFICVPYFLKHDIPWAKHIVTNCRTSFNPINLPFPLSLLLGVQLLTLSLLFPSYPIPWIFLTVSVVQEAFCQCLDFNDNCSICRCIFDVFIFSYSTMLICYIIVFKTIPFLKLLSSL